MSTIEYPHKVAFSLLLFSTMKLALITATQSLRATLDNEELFSHLENAAKQKATLKIRNSKYGEDKWLTLDNQTMITILPPNDIAEITLARCREVELSLYPPIQSIQPAKDLPRGTSVSITGVVMDVDVSNIHTPTVCVWFFRTHYLESLHQAVQNHPTLFKFELENPVVSGFS